MPRARRYIESGGVYEVCFRASDTLPLPCLFVINLIINSAIARAQRDVKVTLCHMLWMINHAHLLLVAKDATQCSLFYSEVQKKITESLKKLLGVKKLKLWSGRALVIRINDLEAAKDKIAYYYANPARANLVDTIDKYPGVNSWQAFNDNLENLEAKSTTYHKWIRQKTIPKLPSRTLTENQDKHFYRMLLSSNEESHELTLEPNAWMKSFGVKHSEDVKIINQDILKITQQKEQKARDDRSLEGKRLWGPSALARQRIMSPHTPKESVRRIYIICSNNLERIRYIQRFKQFCLACKECYLAWKAGQTDVIWPPGAFIPPIPSLANSLTRFA